MKSEKRDLKITDHQIKTFNVLVEIGGWAQSKQIKSHGGHLSAAKALIKYGLVEERTFKNQWGIEKSGLWGYEIKEWRAVPDSSIKQVISTIKKAKQNRE